MSKPPPRPPGWRWISEDELKKLGRFPWLSSIMAFIAGLAWGAWMSHGG